MTSPDQNTQHELRESPVGARYSFADRELLRSDNNFAQGAVQRRIITYPTPSPEQKSLRDALGAKGLLLGREIEGTANDQYHDHFMIPSSARPLSHEAAAADAGAYSYNDTALFFDLGKLLGSIASEGRELPLLLTGAIGHNVAIVEFTRVNEAKSLLVPGFELSVRGVADDDQALTAYGKELYDEFGVRFDHHADYFIDGFRTAIG